MSDDGLRDLFLLREDLVYLNHGSFGACPRAVHRRYQELQRELEANPMAFLSEDRDLSGRMREARRALATYVGARPDDLVFIPNATYGVNVAARSLDLKPGDEVLISDHAYGACERAWRFVCERRGASLKTAHVGLPVESAAAVADEIWRQVTERTRAVFLDHMTSPTALILPVSDLIQRARRSGILSIIDGAHAPGHLPLDLTELGPDIYIGNGHKWLLAPKGAGFLWARADVQPLLQPLIVSWGWRADEPGPSAFVDEQQRTGTHDPSAYLAVPAAIEFLARHDWPQVQRRCRALVREAREQIGRLTGLVPFCPDDGLWYRQMHMLPLPPCDPVRLQRELRERYRIEIPVFAWQGRPCLRISIQAYNTRRDIEALVSALTVLLKEHRVAAG
jgi:isopenicillin-N epimerase